MRSQPSTFKHTTTKTTPRTLRVDPKITIKAVWGKNQGRQTILATEYIVFNLNKKTWRESTMPTPFRSFKLIWHVRIFYHVRMHRTFISSLKVSKFILQKKLLNSQKHETALKSYWLLLHTLINYQDEL